MDAKIYITKEHISGELVDNLLKYPNLPKYKCHQLDPLNAKSSILKVIKEPIQMEFEYTSCKPC